jgi:hypothetical protein
MADNRFEVVPPDTLILEIVAAFESIAVVIALCWAVKVPAFRPKEIPLPSANVMADSRFEVVPPDTLMLEIVAAFESIAVVIALC